MKKISTLTGVLIASFAMLWSSLASADSALAAAKANIEAKGGIIIDGDYLDANTELTLDWSLAPAPIPPELEAAFLGPLGDPSDNIFQFVDCLGNLSLDLCQNYANTAVTYGGMLMPGRDNQCNPATPDAKTSITVPPGAIPGLPPIPVTFTINFPMCSGIQVDEDEAIVVYGVVPPVEGTYWGFQTSMYERHQDIVPRPEDFEPLKPAENPPAPTIPERLLISNDVGDTENQLRLPSAPHPTGELEGDVFIKILTGNKKVAKKLIKSFEKAGYHYVKHDDDDSSSDDDSSDDSSDDKRHGHKKGEKCKAKGHIIVKELPDSHNLVTDEFGDSYREILRVARPFDQDEMDAWMASNPIRPFRVSFPGIKVKRFGPAEFTDRDTGEQQGDGVCGIAASWEDYVASKFGTPTLTTIMNPRIFDDVFSEETGTYAWGNNNDALYLNAMVPELDENGYPLAMQTYDLSGANSRMVLTGIDHVKSGWSVVWNWDIYNGEAINFPGNPPFGSALETFQFSQAAEADYTADKIEFCSQYPEQCACAGAEAVDALYWAQLRQTCEANDDHCIQLCESYEPGSVESQICNATGPSREVMHRVYLSPETKTGPDWFNTRHNRIHYYE